MPTPFGTQDEFFIYSREDSAEKSRCFDFGEFLNARDIENNLGTDVGIIPCFGVISGIGIMTTLMVSGHRQSEL